MVVLVTCKNGEDPIKNEDARVVTTLKINFKDAQGIGNVILTKFKLIQALIIVLLICKYEEDPFLIENTREVTTFLPL